MNSDVPADDVSAAVLGPYILAASQIHGPAICDDVSAHMESVVKTGVGLLLAARTAALDVSRELPIRSYRVTGILSIESTRNANRTQIGIDTGRSQFGADRMWTEFEDQPGAARSRAILESLVGQMVSATKQTFRARDGVGDAAAGGRSATRTRMAPGSLYVIADDGTRTRVNFDAPEART